jgi:hypothetical protein
VNGYEFAVGAVDDYVECGEHPVLTAAVICAEQEGEFTSKERNNLVQLWRTDSNI